MKGRYFSDSKITLAVGELVLLGIEQEHLLLFPHIVSLLIWVRWRIRFVFRHNLVRMNRTH